MTINRIEFTRNGIQVSLAIPVPPDDERSAATPNTIPLSRFVPMRIQRRGIEMRMVIAGHTPPARVDEALLKTVARAYRWADDLFAGRVRSVAEIARREHVSPRYVWRLLPAAFLAPRLVQAIVDGRQPPALTSIALTLRSDLPALWKPQEQALGAA